MLQLSDNTYNRTLARHEPKFKLWTQAGLLLTYRCNAACEFCYYHCDGGKSGLMNVETAMEAWRGLVRIAGATARIHLTGGEPFLYYKRLLEILEAGVRDGLGGADMVETNGFWAIDDAIARRRLATLKSLGLQRFKISVDPFHQAFVEIEPVRRLARIAEEVFGPAHVLVRWRQYLDEPAVAPHSVRDIAYLETLAEYPCRFTGRAAGRLAERVLATPSERPPIARTIDELRNENCRTGWLGARHIHIDPFGNIFSGTCSGIVMANINKAPLDRIWQDLDFRTHPLLRALFEQGPTGLLDMAVAAGYPPRPRYVDKCHLCTDIRTFFRAHGLEPAVIGPTECYP